MRTLSKGWNQDDYDEAFIENKNLSEYYESDLIIRKNHTTNTLLKNQGIRMYDSLSENCQLQMNRKFREYVDKY